MEVRVFAFCRVHVVFCNRCKFHILDLWENALSYVLPDRKKFPSAQFLVCCALFYPLLILLWEVLRQ